MSLCLNLHIKIYSAINKLNGDFQKSDNKQKTKQKFSEMFNCICVKMIELEAQKNAHTKE